MRFGLVQSAGTVAVLAMVFASHTQAQAQFGSGAPSLVHESGGSMEMDSNTVFYHHRVLKEQTYA
jgi:hypothetical protein